jgi:hypothetical protein
MPYMESTSLPTETALVSLASQPAVVYLDPGADGCPVGATDDARCEDHGGVRKIMGAAAIASGPTGSGSANGKLS